MNDIKRKSYITDQAADLLDVNPAWLTYRAKKFSDSFIGDLSDLERLAVFYVPRPPTLIDYLLVSGDYEANLEMLAEIPFTPTELCVLVTWERMGFPAAANHMGYHRQHLHETKAKVRDALGLSPPPRWRLAWRWPGLIPWSALRDGGAVARTLELLEPEAEIFSRRAVALREVVERLTNA